MGFYYQLNHHKFTKLIRLHFLKKLAAYCLFFCVAFTAKSQYYLRGIIRDEKNNKLSNAKIFLHSSKSYFATGSDGGFGIPAKKLHDSVTVTLSGYNSQTLAVKTDIWVSIVLKITAETIVKYKPKLISFTKDAKESSRFNPFVSDETYFKLVENEIVKTEKFPNSGFSLNVNKASYSNVRRFLNMQSSVPPDAVRIEEMINYFNLDYESPQENKTFNIRSAITACPWNANNNLLYLKISARKLKLDKIPPSNFVFLIDVSGSMDLPNRLPLLKEAFQLFVKNLRPVDKISIITYGGVVGIWLEPTNGDEKEKINNSLELLTAAGDTPGESAIVAAYKLANESFIKDGNNRVILATDGDFNVGQTSEKSLDELITKKRETGIYLTCLGVGMGNFKDSKLQTLAKRGNGNYAYIDNLHEAEKVLVKELTETLYSVADNAFINVIFNDKQISAYRLIGFDNNRDAVQDGYSEIEGGEMGSGSSTMAIFEIVPTIKCNVGNNIAKLKLKFHEPRAPVDSIKDIFFDIIYNKTDTATNSENFAAAVAMFGLKLKDSPYLNNATWSDVKSFALKAANPKIFLQNDFLILMEKAIKIYDPGKKKRKNKKED